MLITAQLESKVLGMPVDCMAVLPPDARPLRCVYLLHGGSGDETKWMMNSAAPRYAEEYGVAFITMNAGPSCFTNMAHGGRYLDFVGCELVELTRRIFPRLSRRREDTYVSGLSNGGYGSVLVGLSYPETFAAIGAFSAGNKADVAFENDGSAKSLSRIALFGDGDIHNTAHDIHSLARKLAAGGGVLPRCYHACGADDPWVDLNRMLRDTIQSIDGNPYDYRYHEPEGYAHEWSFWDLELRLFLEYLGLPKLQGR